MPFHQESFNFAQVAVANTATRIVAANTNRESVVVVNHGTVDVFLGDSAVTTTTGIMLVGNKGASVSIPTTSALYGIVAAGTETVGYLEVIS